MQAEIARRFQDGSLVPASGIEEIKHIGDYLAEGLRRTFSPQSRRLTIRVFARRIAPLSVEELRAKLQRALQNRRANECVADSSSAQYHVRDVNMYGFKACRALIHALAKGRDGHGLGANFRVDYRRLQNPRRREDAAYMSCLSRRACGLAGGVWADRLCLPSPGQRGFEGVGPYSGQKKLRSSRERVRGQYAVARSGEQWRRPGPLRRV